MPILATAEATFTRELIPADTYVARCIEMIQIGTVETTYQGKVKRQPKLRITWELPDHLVEYKDKEEPARIGETYTLTLDERGNLRGMLIGWRGVDFTPEQLDGFDLEVLVGMPCLLTVTHGKGADGKTYANISSVSKLMKNMTCPDQFHPKVTLSYGQFDWEKFNKLPDFLKKKMEATPEYKALKQPDAESQPAQAAAATQAAGAIAATGDEDLPF